MANPKYIDESLLPKEEEEDIVNKKGSKKAYSFRCDETLLEDMTTYAKLDDISLPQLLSNLMADFLNDKVLSNDYLRGYAGIYINIPSNAVGSRIFEYELRFIMNNLDVWNSSYGYVSKRHESEHKMYDGILHEGIDFLVIPETVHGAKLPDDEIRGLRCHHVELDYIPSCLYCMYVTVDNNHVVEYEVISWITAMNKLKAVGRYDLIAHGNKIKKRLNNLHQRWITERGWYDDLFTDDIYVQLVRIAEEYNTGAILPADRSIDNIEYLPVIEKLPDAYEIISDLVKENKRLKKMEDKFNDIRAKIEEIENMNREEVWQEFIKGSDDNQDEISDDPKNE